MKKGFTLIELLAVIAILAIVLLVAIPKIIDVLNTAKASAYKSNGDLIIKAAENYLAANPNNFPNNIGDTVEITLTDLQANNYITSIKDPYDNNITCDGYIIVTKTTPTTYDYTPYLKCGTSNDISNSTEDGLLLYYKFDDFQEPTANLIPGGTINTYPQIGNGHTTYNTNQYNSNTYFSIGTIDNITNNIVTLSSVSHPIYTYDVLTPQTTGGGVTAGTRYFIKKLSPTTFALYPYDNTPDGSKGFAVYNSIYNDQKININSTNFPTMWYGPPHAPNSALVKEVLSGCFSSTSTTLHECIRFHTEHKPEGLVDGMAYGVCPVVTFGETYTFSFYYRAVNQASVGSTVRLDLYTTTDWVGDNLVKTITSTNWERYEMTVTAPASGGTNLYFWPSKGSTIDISEIQCEHKAWATPFTPTTSSGIISDYSTNHNTSTLALNTTPKWISSGRNNKGSYQFDGTNDLITIPDLSFTQNVFTFSFWINPSTEGIDAPMVLTPQSNGLDQFIRYDYNANRIYLGIAEAQDINQRGWYTPSNSVSKGEWSNVTIVINNQIVKIYINGELVQESIETLPIGLWSGTWALGQRGNETYLFKGLIDDVQIYNRALSADEINRYYNSNQ